MNGILPLRDIKPLIDIADYSLYFFLFSFFVSLIAFMVFVYFIYNVVLFYRNKKRVLKSLLKDITLLKLDDSKKFAYEWTRHTNKIKDEFQALKITKYLDTLESMRLFSDELELYKYKSKSDILDTNTINKFSKLKDKILAISF